MLQGQIVRFLRGGGTGANHFFFSLRSKSNFSFLGADAGAGGKVIGNG